MLIDSDMHLFEGRSTWRDHLPASEQDLALDIVDDDNGYPWLVHGDQRITLVEPHRPGQVNAIGEFRQKQLAGRPNELDYDGLVADFSDPQARLRFLDQVGLDQAVLFPNYGITWERALEHDLPATLANMTAWNRWAVEVAHDGGGRLHPVAHLSMRDLEWCDRQLAELSAGGVRLALIAPSLVDGKPLSDPAFDRLWSAFVDRGVTPVFHVADQPRPFDDAWYRDPPDAQLSVLSSVFLWTAPALAVTDLILNGVFQRHPDLRLGIMELSAIWVPLHLQMMDGGHNFVTTFNGAPAVPLELKPSEYFRQHVRVAAFSYERPNILTRQAGDIFMACSDYPHTEGTLSPVEDYRAAQCEPEEMPGLFGDNVGFLLRAS